jgi:hypothetical protein
MQTMKKADVFVRKLREKAAQLGPGSNARGRDAVAYAAALEILG